MNGKVTEAGQYTISSGIFHGRQHTFVTHQETGKQWVSKSPEENRDHSMLADLIICRITKFHPDREVCCCDTRFWMRVSRPAPRSDFDSLVFIGE